MSDFELITKKYAGSKFATGPELSSVKTELSEVKEGLNDKQSKLMTFSEDEVHDTVIAATNITMRAGSDTVGVIVTEDNRINIDTESIKIEQKQNNDWKNVLKSHIEYYSPSSVQLGDSDTITIIDGKSVFVNGPLMTVDGSLFVSGPVIKEITSSDNSVSIYVNGPSVDLKVSSGGGIDPAAISEMFSTYATYDYAHRLRNAGLYYDANITRTAHKSQSPIIMPAYMLQTVMNINYHFPQFSTVIPLDVMFQQIKTTKDNVYVGVNAGSLGLKVGDTFKQLAFITDEPLGAAGEHTNVAFKINFIDTTSIDGYGWNSYGPYPGNKVTGWFPCTSQGRWGEFVKKTVDGEEVYECVGTLNLDGFSSFSPLPSDTDSVIQKTNSVDGEIHFDWRAYQYTSSPFLVTIRYIVAPANPALPNQFITKKQVADLFSFAETSEELATIEYVNQKAKEHWRIQDWDMDYAPYQPDLPEE